VKLVKNLGESAGIQCHTKLDITWNFENGALPGNVELFYSFDVHSLYVKRVEKEHFGTYACIGKERGYGPFEYFTSESVIEEGRSCSQTRVYIIFERSQLFKGSHSSIEERIRIIWYLRLTRETTINILTVFSSESSFDKSNLE